MYRLRSNHKQLNCLFIYLSVPQLRSTIDPFGTTGSQQVVFLSIFLLEQFPSSVPTFVHSTTTCLTRTYIFRTPTRTRVPELYHKGFKATRDERKECLLWPGRGEEGGRSTLSQTMYSVTDCINVRGEITDFEPRLLLSIKTKQKVHTL